MPALPALPRPYLALENCRFPPSSLILSLAYIVPEYTWLKAGVGSRPSFAVYLKMLVRPKAVVATGSLVAQGGWGDRHSHPS